MSADNWGYCPKCKKERVETENKLADEMMQAKKLNSLSAFEEAKEKYNEFIREEMRNAFREDYEIHVSEDGEFYVSYSGECMDCGFSHHYKLQTQLDLS